LALDHDRQESGQPLFASVHKRLLLKYPRIDAVKDQPTSGSKVDDRFFFCGHVIWPA